VTDPVTVFMLVVAGLLVVGTVGEQVFVRTGLPAVIWLILLGVMVRLAGIVPEPVITGLAPFFAALALVIILFDAGTNLNGGVTDDLSGGTAEVTLAPATRKRALLLAFVGFAVTVVLVALFSLAVAALDILPRWSWAHAFMLGSLVGCGASEVALPSLLVRRGLDEVTALLRRESAISKALAVTGTVVCLDLLSPRVADGGAGLAMVAGFGFALAFGSVAGMLWVVALQRLAGEGAGADQREARNYGFTLAVMVVLYVLSEAAGGSGPLSVLVFGVVLGNAGGLLGLLRRGAGEDAAAGASVRAALGGHARTIEFVRTLMFAMVGLTLAPPWGPLVMGVALAFLVLIVRLAVARFTLVGLDHHERSAIGLGAPRGMATVALATLPLAHAVPGAETMVTLVFAMVTTSVLLFTIGLRGLRPVAPARAAAPVVPAVRPSLGSMIAAEVAVSHPGSTLRAPVIADDGEAHDGGLGEVVPMSLPPIAAPVATAPVTMPSIAAPPIATHPIAAPPVAAPIAAHPIAPPTAAPVTPLATAPAPAGTATAPMVTPPAASPVAGDPSNLSFGTDSSDLSAGTAFPALTPPGFSAPSVVPVFAPPGQITGTTLPGVAPAQTGTTLPGLPSLSSGTAAPVFAPTPWAPAPVAAEPEPEEPPLVIEDEAKG
jgi:cell volume regulation protein A